MYSMLTTHCVFILYAIVHPICAGRERQSFWGFYHCIINFVIFFLNMSPLYGRYNSAFVGFKGVKFRYTPNFHLPVIYFWMRSWTQTFPFMIYTVLYICLPKLTQTELNVIYLSPCHNTQIIKCKTTKHSHQAFIFIFCVTISLQDTFKYKHQRLLLFTDLSLYWIVLLIIIFFSFHN